MKTVDLIRLIKLLKLEIKEIKLKIAEIPPEIKTWGGYKQHRWEEAELRLRRAQLILAREVLMGVKPSRKWPIMFDKEKTQ